MRIVLDTSAFWRPQALRDLATSAMEVVVPAVVFTERCRQIIRDGRKIEELTRLLTELQFHVEPFGTAEGLRYAARLTDDRAWERLARDAMIAGHVGDGDSLWTANPGDFLAVGVPADRIVDLSGLPKP